MPALRSAAPAPADPPRAILLDLIPNRIGLSCITDCVRQRARTAQHLPHAIPQVVAWVERYVRFYPTKPFGRLDATHATAFLSHLGRQHTVAPSEQAQARDAIAFFHTAVLGQSGFRIPDDYVRAARS